MINMITEKALEEFNSARIRYNQAKNRNSGITFEKERLKNLLFNYHEELLDSAKEIAQLQNEIEGLRQQNSILNTSVETLTKKLNDLNRQKKKASPDTEG